VGVKAVIRAGALVFLIHAGNAGAGTHAPIPPGEQEKITATHLDLAFQAVFISRTLRAFDEVLPNLVRRTENQLIEKHPNLKADIIRTVDAVALELAERQTELDLVIARRWAGRFSIEELREITAFYATPTGTKFAKQNVELIAEELDAARVWGAEIGRELVSQVRQKLKAEGHDL